MLLDGDAAGAEGDFAARTVRGEEREERGERRGREGQIVRNVDGGGKMKR